MAPQSRQYALVLPTGSNPGEEQILQTSPAVALERTAAESWERLQAIWGDEIWDNLLVMASQEKS